MQSIKLMPEYGQTVLWHHGGDKVGPIDASQLPISEELRCSLKEWAFTYDDTFNQENPRDSGFSSPEQEAAFEEEGMRLWRQLQSELGSEWNVVYFSNRLGKLIE